MYFIYIIFMLFDTSQSLGKNQHDVAIYRMPTREHCTVSCGSVVVGHPCFFVVGRQGCRKVLSAPAQRAPVKSHWRLDLTELVCCEKQGLSASARMHSVICSALVILIFSK